MMQHYELLLLIPGSINDGEIPAIKEKAAVFITKIGGKITKDLDWERRKLAYAIKQETFGHYWLFEFDAESTGLKELHHQLSLTPEILRFLLTTAKVKTAEEIKHDEMIQEKIKARKAEKVKKELKEVKEIEKKVEEPKKEEEKTEGKVTMEDLDKKLDEILGSDLKV